ncbi:hypothetical protein [Alkanindiges illinoisensis]|uniref:hypothetical protein n=1 Tax=Alkanindiges illinoisensis TaxID=197183 RepID=UPI0004793F1C|nr:hypothetical protein [Alkanindiges illinoisensis]
MRNKLIDLNDHLFAQLERLGDETLSGEALQNELGRSKAMTGVAAQIIENARLAMDAEKFRVDYQKGVVSLPAMIGAKQDA